ncbi:MAG: hypothetical protein KIS89_05910, partial [Dokdonella sp.]|nr:hypothetical protein [Dokdonella sp.]
MSRLRRAGIGAISPSAKKPLPSANAMTARISINMQDVAGPLAPRCGAGALQQRTARGRRGGPLAAPAA